MADPIQMLWIGPRLSALERLSIRSFLSNGHPVRLFSYERVEGIPDGVEHHDGREIMPADSIFTFSGEGFGKGSLATFANIFRYKLLLDHGGIWSDADMVCLRPFDFAGEYVVATERLPPDERTGEKRGRFNNCLLKIPRASPIMLECHTIASQADKKLLRWGQIGPQLVTERFLHHGLQRFALPIAAVCPVDWWNAHELVTKPLPDVSESYGVHFWNEVWRYKGIDKDAKYPVHCAYEALKDRYGV